MNKPLSYSLSDSDIRKILGKDTRIITYPQLKNYKTIDQVLEINNCCVILIETSINAGHWICLLKYGNTVEHFDSYGLNVSDELSYVNLSTRKHLGENKALLSALLDDCPYKVIYNKKDLQSWTAGTNDCGRWVCLRLLNRNIALGQFLKFVDSFHAKNTDALVCELIKV